MYLRTPKRYRANHKRRHLRLFSKRIMVLLLVIPAALLLAQYMRNNPSKVEDLRTDIADSAGNIVENVQTQVAQPPTPTATPDLDAALNGCNNARQGDLNEAIEQCTILAENTPNDARLYYEVTNMLIITSNFGADTDKITRALDFAERTINANPEAPHGWAIQAMALDWSGDYGSALASALHAKALDDQFAPAYAVLGEVYHDMGDDETANSYLTRALELDTGTSIAYIFRIQGKIYMDQGYYEDAIPLYDRALQQAPNYAYIAFELAANHRAMGDYDTAIEILTRELDYNPNDPAVLWLLARVHLQNGNKERAYEYYHRCLDTNPNNVLCLSYLGGLQLVDEDYEAAIENLERAIELGSEDMDDFLELGRALAAQGRCSEAIPYYQRGYQMAVEKKNDEKQASFVSALQLCNSGPAIITTPVSITPTVQP
jgi:tetratricopeptide (TPR) repeat protein